MRKLLTLIKLYIKQGACEHYVQTFVCHNFGERIGCSNSTTWKCNDCKKIFYTDGIEKEIGDKGTMHRIWNSYHNSYIVKGGYIIDESE